MNRIHGNYEYQDRSKIYDEISPGRIERVVSTTDSSGNMIMKVKVRILKKYDVGDKIASQSAQKSTNSLSMKSIDMPFTTNGIVPDIIFNPHGLITRMTIAQIIMMALGIIAAERGITIDGTPFTNLNIERDVTSILKHIGYKNYGKRRMINGITGRIMESDIYMAPLYYQRLKHMVKSKAAFRDIGFNNHTTKQPSQGRKKKGGFRIGHMMKDAFISHGTNNILLEKFFNHADAWSCYISEETGHLCIGNEREHLFKDKKNNTKIAKVYLPWVFIMIYYLVQTMGISMEFILE
jgi:DNA-directed RNA polymerase beta subunit